MRVQKVLGKLRFLLFNNVVIERENRYLATTSKGSIIDREIERVRRLECKVANFMWGILVTL